MGKEAVPHLRGPSHSNAVFINASGCKFLTLNTAALKSWKSYFFIKDHLIIIVQTPLSSTKVLNQTAKCCITRSSYILPWNINMHNNEIIKTICRLTSKLYLTDQTYTFFNFFFNLCSIRNVQNHSSNPASSCY